MPSWPHENLRNLERSRSLLPEKASASEISGYLASSSSYLADAANESISIAGRFLVTYSACHSLAVAALRANDYRTAQEKGHRVLVFDLLPATCGAGKTDALVLHRAHERRNAVEYSGGAAISERELRDLIAVAGRVKEAVHGWLRVNRPDLWQGFK